MLIEKQEWQCAAGWERNANFEVLLVLVGYLFIGHLFTYWAIYYLSYLYALGGREDTVSHSPSVARTFVSVVIQEGTDDRKSFGPSGYQSSLDFALFAVRSCADLRDLAGGIFCLPWSSDRLRTTNTRGWTGTNMASDGRKTKDPRNMRQNVQIVRRTAINELI